MSRNRHKGLPLKGQIISSMWKYAVVVAVRDDNDEYRILETSKHRKLKDAQLVAKQDNDRERNYMQGRPSIRQYCVAEWTQNAEGEIVLELMEDVKL